MIRFLVGLVLILVLFTSTAIAVHPHATRPTPFHPNVGRVPVGVPARNFAPRHHFVPSAGFGIGYGYVPAANFGVPFSYGVPAAAVPVGFAPAYAPGGCGQYFPGRSLAPVFAPGGCGY